MQDEKPAPIVFGNRVIQQFAENFGKDPSAWKPSDYTAMRLTFRALGGRWFELFQGSITHLLLLSRVIKGYGQDSGK